MNKILVLVLTLAIILIWFSSYQVMIHIFPTGERGEVGEMFGAIESLFSGLALAGVIVTIYLQQKANVSQTFDNSFFHLLAFYNQIISEARFMDGVESGGTSQGRRAFLTFHQTLEKEYNKEKSRLNEKIQDLEVGSQEWISAYREYLSDNFVYLFLEKYKEHQAAFGHYVRTAHEILKFIENSNLKRSKRQDYANIFRAQLSSHELLFLYYEVIIEFKKEFNPLEREYNLLKYLPRHLIIDENLLKIYNPDK
ncbi:MAG: putative phage abortive infection protein [Lewinellaceae bacterium]|nr:putative phage abortive infection protein [Lewinellaceae bacterium]